MANLINEEIKLYLVWPSKAVKNVTHATLYKTLKETVRIKQDIEKEHGNVV